MFKNHLTLKMKLNKYIEILKSKISTYNVVKVVHKITPYLV